MTGRRVVITSASSGIGYALAEAGATVLLTARSVARLNSAVEQLQKEGGQVFGQPMDVRSENSIQQVIAWVEKQWGGLDVLINNAGIGMRIVNPSFLSHPQPFYEVSAEGFRDVIDTNLTGYFLVTKAFMPLFLQNGTGKIINISMNHKTMKRKGFVPYGPSRAGAESLSYIMAEDLREKGIDVNMLLPGGATNTGMIPEAYRQSFKEQGLLLPPEKMGEPIIFLASEESNGITGERIVAKDFTAWKQASSHSNT